MWPENDYWDMLLKKKGLSFNDLIWFFKNGIKFCYVDTAYLNMLLLRE